MLLLFLCGCSLVACGNGVVVECAPDTLCRRSAFDDTSTSREDQLTTFRGLRCNNFQPDASASYGVQVGVSTTLFCFVFLVVLSGDAHSAL